MSTSKEGEQMRELINTVKKATETKVLVKHMEDSSQYDSKDYGWESWKAFWAERTNNEVPQMDYYCPSCKEYKDDIDGGHVVYNNKMYITPVCHTCNSRASKNIEFRETPFEIQFNKLVLFNPNELKNMRG